MTWWWENENFFFFLFCLILVVVKKESQLDPSSMCFFEGKNPFRDKWDRKIIVMVFLKLFYNLEKKSLK